MVTSKFNIKKEFPQLVAAIKTLDKKVIIVFISIAVLQTISWYYTSRTFFKFNLFNSLSSDPDVYWYEFVYWYAGDFITLFIIPALIIKFIFKEKIRDYGVKVGDFNSGMKMSLLFLMVMIPLIWLVSSQQGFSLTYPLMARARDSWKIFIFYECGLLFYLFAWEFTWRGFMLFGLKEKFGYYAVLMQMIPFVILHNGKPPVETFGAILGGVALGILAYRTESIYYCMVTHAGVLFCMDFFSTLRYRANDFGLGIKSVFHVLKQII
jgi:membrane protease YdiL (CAAX protease family)